MEKEQIESYLKRLQEDIEYDKNNSDWLKDYYSAQISILERIQRDVLK